MPENYQFCGTKNFLLLPTDYEKIHVSLDYHKYQCNLVVDKSTKDVIINGGEKI